MPKQTTRQQPAPEIQRFGEAAVLRRNLDPALEAKRRRQDVKRIAFPAMVEIVRTLYPDDEMVYKVIEEGCQVTARAVRFWRKGDRRPTLKRLDMLQEFLLKRAEQFVDAANKVDKIGSTSYR